MSGERLFCEEALERAASHRAGSHFRWLALAEDPEAVALRAALERGFSHAGGARDSLRKGLMHERWGQHAGALAHLLALELLAARGWRLECEPALSGQAPDILAAHDGVVRPLLVEVRAITGAGEFPWEERRTAGGPGGGRREGERRQALADAVARVLLKKADAYRVLARRLELPLVLCLYEDKDDQIGGIVADLSRRAGLFLGERERLACLSAVLVLRRLDNDSGALELRSELIANPLAERPLAAAAAAALGA